MKRFWLAMLSLGLVLAFSASAMAVDVKFSGSFYAAGMYQDMTSFRSTNEDSVYLLDSTYRAIATVYPLYTYGSLGGTLTTFGVLSSLRGLYDYQYERVGGGSVGHSTAFYYQRLRVETDFIVSPGLKLVTRFDALERIWGGVRGDGPYQGGFVNYNYDPSDSQSAGTRTERQNIAFDWAYIDYISPIGLFQVGYMEDNGWGTVFGDNAINGASVGAISYTVPIGQFYINAKITKANDNSSSAIAPSSTTDSDNDSYSACAIWVPNKDIQIGLLGAYKRVASGRADVYINPYSLPAMVKAYAYTVNPYFKAKFGPVAVEGELNYAIGKGKWEGAPVDPLIALEYPDMVDGYDSKIENLTGYLSAVADFGMFYGGATFAYVSGDVAATAIDKLEGGFIDGGVDFQPCLLMFSNDRNYWAGSIPGYGYAYSGMWLGSQGPTPNGGVMSNAWFGQGKIGVRPIPALDIMASLSYAKADEIPTTVLEKEYGWEIDVTGTYKITNNLSYMLGGAYLFTGDYYKGTNLNDVKDNFLIINKLTLTF